MLYHALQPVRTSVHTLLQSCVDAGASDEMVSPVYKDWCEKSGIKRYGIEAAFVEHGWRGVVATEAIAAGATILEVPEGLLMTGRSAMADAHLRRVLEANPGLSPVQVCLHVAMQCLECRMRAHN